MSRPRSAASVRQSSVSNAPSSRRASTSTRDNLIYECKAAYLAVFEELDDDIESTDDLYKGQLIMTFQLLGYSQKSVKKEVCKYESTEQLQIVCLKRLLNFGKSLRVEFCKITINVLLISKSKVSFNKGSALIISRMNEFNQITLRNFSNNLQPFCFKICC